MFDASYILNGKRFAVQLRHPVPVFNIGKENENEENRISLKLLGTRRGRARGCQSV